MAKFSSLLSALSTILISVSSVFASAGDTINFSIEKALNEKDGRVIKISSLPCPISNVFWVGQIEVDVQSKRPGVKTATLKDTTFALEWLSDGSEKCTTNLRIDLANLVGRYYSEETGKKEIDVTIEDVEFIKRVGKNWRLIKTRSR